VTRGVVFDIDDTLYLERDYVRSGFAHVARWLGATSAETGAWSTWLWMAFESGVRHDTFDRFLQAHPNVGERRSVADLVAVYRAHAPTIQLEDEVVDVLRRLRREGRSLGALSDGPSVSQTAKVNALGLAGWFDPIVLTDDLGPGRSKPSVAGFALFERSWRMSGAEITYVADNPAKDFAAPRRLGWQTVRLRRDGQLYRDVEPRGDADRSDVEIVALPELADLLR